MFSQRIDWHAPPNALSDLLARKKAAGRSLLDLTQSNPTRAGLNYDQEAILGALARPGALVYEPDPRGRPDALQAIADYYRGLGSPLDVDRLFLTASTSEAYGFLFKLLGDAGDEVLIPTPGYPLLAYLARFEGLRAVSYPTRYEEDSGWSIDLEVLQALVTPRTRAVLAVSPNNPTGAYLKPAERTALDDLCSRHGMALVVDEVFADYAGPAAPPAHLPTVAGRTGCLTFVLNGFSKLVALPQVKLGWIGIGGDAALAREAGRRLEALLDFYLSVASPVQHAVGALLAGRAAIQRQIIHRLDLNEGWLCAQAARSGQARVLRREGGWYAVVEIRDALNDEARVLGLLDRHDTLVHPGFFYDFHRDGFVVLSLLTPPETFQAGAARLLAFQPK
jgi:aspartate/methionine/tyrosine aminotransferase